MKRISCLEGHTERVLYASISPGIFFIFYFIDETSLVSGSGDETLKFWNIFPK
jgi:cell division cycle 20-like protein 1 (cofactor of APC complex)